jgi:hypothetical protein
MVVEIGEYGGLMAKIVRFKYIRGRPLSLMEKKQGDSHF